MYISILIYSFWLLILFIHSVYSVGKEHLPGVRKEHLLGVRKELLQRIIRAESCAQSWRARLHRCACGGPNELNLRIELN